MIRNRAISSVARRGDFEPLPPSMRSHIPRALNTGQAPSDQRGVLNRLGTSESVRRDCHPLRHSLDVVAPFFSPGLALFAYGPSTMDTAPTTSGASPPWPVTMSTATRAATTAAMTSGPLPTCSVCIEYSLDGCSRPPQGSLEAPVAGLFQGTMLQPRDCARSRYRDKRDAVI